MDYFQGVVAEYLRANRATFVNPEFLLQLDGNPNSPQKDAHWYVDLLAVNLKEPAVYLCEVTYSTTLASLVRKLSAWSAKWELLCEALRRDAGAGDDWPVRPWIFVPEHAISKLLIKLPQMLVKPKITSLEMTQPWEFCTWNRVGEKEKPVTIPGEMR